MNRRGSKITQHFGTVTPAACIHYGAAGHNVRGRNKTLDVAPVSFGYNAQLSRFPDAQHHRSPQRLLRRKHLVY